jgi:hypothetical protein
MKNCIECNSEYNDVNLEIPKELPDGMCSICGTLLSDNRIQEIIEQLTNRIINLENK